MQAIILAAGFGNRMKPLTQTIHKTLLEVGGKTIIGRIIDSLVEHSIHSITLVTGYRADELTAYVTQKYPGISFHIVENVRYRETNNIFSLALAFDQMQITEDVLLIESDLIYEPSVISKIINSNYDNVALLDHYRSGMDGTVVTVANGIITNVIPPHLQGKDFNFSDKYKTLNIYKFSNSFCNSTFKKLLTYYANVINDNCYYELILGVLIYMQQSTVHAEIIDGQKWAEVDDPNDLRVAEFIFNNAKKSELLENTFGGYWAHDILDFCFIRNMYFPNTAMLSEIKNNIVNLLHNYGSKQEILNLKLSYFLLCNIDHIQLLNGASQIYPILQEIMNGKKVLMPNPTFGEYERIFTKKNYYEDKIGISIEQIIRHAENNDVIVFVNPNNPTGSFLPADEIFRFAEANQNKIIIVDESFIEFTGESSIIPKVEKKPLNNIIVVKSLSKTLGIPGARLGYVFSTNESFIRNIGLKIPIWNTNSIAEFVLEIILKHRKSLVDSFRQTMVDRSNFQKQLSAIPAVEKVYPSGGNYLLVEINKDHKRNFVDELLKRNSIYVKDVTQKFNNGKQYLRLAVRTPLDNDFLVQSLNLLEKQK